MNITESEFRDLLEKAKVPVVVAFSADWCGPCKRFAPTFASAAKSLAPDFSLCKVDIDEASALCEEVGVRVVPTVMVFEGNKKIATHEGGFATQKELEKFITSSRPSG